MSKNKYIKQSFMWVGIILILTFIVAIACTNTTRKTSPTHISSAESQVVEIKTKTEKKTEIIPHGTKIIEDQNLEYGKTIVRTTGSDGIKTYTYNVTYEGDKEIKRELIKTEITEEAIDEVIAKGTRIKWVCRDVTSYDYNWNNDMLCTSSTGEQRYTSYSGARQLENI